MTVAHIAALARGGTQQRINRVVIHATVSPCVAGGARANARWFQDPKAKVSAHLVVDPGEVVRCLDDDVVGFHAPPNEGSIGVELCDPMSGPASRWDDDEHRAMLKRAAELVADLCARHDLPIRRLYPADLLAGKRGITTHAAVSLAWGRSSHTDPGNAFPMTAFLTLVRQAAAPPAPIAQEDDTVTDADIEKVAQRTRALVREDLRTILGGDPAAPDVDLTHYSLADVGRQLAEVLRRLAALTKP